MKALSIGRDQDCDIVINDQTDVISRRHAVLNVSSSGKFTIVDLSRNGTYVNGIRISQNVPVPVSRKDLISFAHVVKLDWNVVPVFSSMMRYIIMGVIGVFVVVCGLLAYNYIPEQPLGDDQEEVVAADTVKDEHQGEKKDSVSMKKEVEKQQEDSTEMIKQKKVKAEDKETHKEKTPQPTAPKDTTKNNRPIG